MIRKKPMIPNSSKMARTLFLVKRDINGVIFVKVKDEYETLEA